MSLDQRVLYQFPLSLYCEKTRWNLDAKGLDYTGRDLVPGLHAPTAWRLAGQRCLPILVDGQHRIGDSTKIALYLENTYPERALLPVDEAARKRVLQLEDFFDELGDHVRRYCWSLAVERDEVSDIFFNFSGYSRWQRMLADSSKPLLRQMIRRTFQVYEPRVADSWEKIQNTLLQMEDWLQGNVNHYLVEDRFTLADLTAASMLAPLFGPENSPWTDVRMPPLTQQFRAESRSTLAGQWVLRIYRDYRVGDWIFKNGDSLI